MPCPHDSSHLPVPVLPLGCHSNPIVHTLVAFLNDHPNEHRCTVCLKSPQRFMYSCFSSPCCGFSIAPLPAASIILMINCVISSCSCAFLPYLDPSGLGGNPGMLSLWWCPLPSFTLLALECVSHGGELQTKRTSFLSTPALLHMYSSACSPVMLVIDRRSILSAGVPSLVLSATKYIESFSLGCHESASSSLFCRRLLFQAHPFSSHVSLLQNGFRHPWALLHLPFGLCLTSPVSRLSLRLLCPGPPCVSLLWPFHTP